MSDKDMIVAKFWGFPAHVRNTIEDLLLFYGECVVWFEDGRFHMTWPGCTMKPENASDYESFGRVTRDRLPDLWAFKLGRAS